MIAKFEQQSNGALLGIYIEPRGRALTGCVASIALPRGLGAEDTRKQSQLVWSVLGQETCRLKYCCRAGWMREQDSHLELGSNKGEREANHEEGGKADSHGHLARGTRGEGHYVDGVKR